MFKCYSMMGVITAGYRDPLCTRQFQLVAEERHVFQPNGVVTWRDAEGGSPVIRSCLCILFVTFAVGGAFADSPTNDDFASATVISGSSGQTSGTNVEATKEVGEPDHAGNAGGASVWYSWTASADGMVYVDTIGSNYEHCDATSATAVRPYRRVGDRLMPISPTAQVHYGLPERSFGSRRESWRRACRSLSAGFASKSVRMCSPDRCLRSLRFAATASTAFLRDPIKSVARRCNSRRRASTFVRSSASLRKSVVASCGGAR